MFTPKEGNWVWRRGAIDRSLTTFRMLGTVILDDTIDDSQLRPVLFQQIDR
jgi:hypothetical protein